MSRPLRDRLEDGYPPDIGIYGLNATKEEVIGLLDTLKLIAHQSCTTPGCISRVCCIAAMARVALRNVGEKI